LSPAKHHIEGCCAAHEPLLSEPNDEHGNGVDDHSAQTPLEHADVLAFQPKAERCPRNRVHVTHSCEKQDNDIRQREFVCRMTVSLRLIEREYTEQLDPRNEGD